VPEQGERRRGRPPRTEAQRAEQRRRLTTAAMDAIRTRGPDLSIDELAAAAGVSKPVLYDEFGGKLGIADAIAVVLAEQVEREVLDAVLTSGSFDLPLALRSLVDALVTLIDGEPALYAFLVRSIRSSDRGFLDNALVRVIHERASVIFATIAPDVPPEEVEVLTDGVFGFMFGAVESWQASRRVDQARLVDTLAVAIAEGLRAVATRPSKG
jgi:AcrR family transcriptional regulator